MIKKLLAESQKDNKTLIMGVMNITPDSFSDGGKLSNPQQALKHAQQLINDGADILDIGGESTRPGAPEIALQEELDRVIPVIELIKQNSDIAISVDTSKPDVMDAAIKMNADMINDVTGMENAQSRKIVAKADIPVCIMHMQGDPRSMQKQPAYDDVVANVSSYLEKMAARCEQDGIKQSNLIVDPGIGFGKTLEHNLTLLAATQSIRELGYPILIGVSRKSFIDHLLNRKVDERLAGSIGAGVYAASKGAEILRVHDVKETFDAVRMFEAIASHN